MWATGAAAFAGYRMPMASTMDVSGSDFHAFGVSFPDAVEAEFREAYGAERWANIKHRLALPPRYTGVRVNTMRTTREAVIEALEKHLEPFNQQLVEQTAREPIKPTAHPTLSDVVVIPSAPAVSRPSPVSYRSDWKSIIVDRLCGEAVLRGSDIFARGVMSASSGINTGDRVNIFVDLDHISTRGSDVLEHTGRRLFIAHGTMVMARTEIFRAQRGLAITGITRVCSDAPPMNGVLPGDIYVQNLPSTVVAHALDPQEGDVIIDMCAAPGGKTSHVATLMKNKGVLIACDKSKRKAIELKKLFSEELPYDIVTPLRLDSMHSVVPKNDGPVLSVREVLEQAKAKTPKDSQLLKVEGFHPETFDRILLDPPCSALGLRPRLLHAGDEDDLAIFSSMQRNFLWCASFLLKPGGTLVYSTCTINPKENEQMVRYALDNFPLQLVKQDFHVGDTGLLNQGLSEEEASLVQRFDPSNEALDTMGFFCAKFIKTKSIRKE